MDRIFVSFLRGPHTRVDTHTYAGRWTDTEGFSGARIGPVRSGASSSFPCRGAAMQLQPQLPDLVLALKPRLVRHLPRKRCITKGGTRDASTRRDAIPATTASQTRRSFFLCLSLPLVWLRDMLSPSGPDLEVTTLLEVRANETCILFYTHCCHASSILTGTLVASVLTPNANHFFANKKQRCNVRFCSRNVTEISYIKRRY